MARPQGISGSMTDMDLLDWRRLLTAAERTAMLDDIAHVSLAAGAALFPEQPWSDLAVAAGPLNALKSPVEQLGLIEYLLPVLTSALRQITHSPLTAATIQTQAALPQRARRVTTAAWMDYARRSPAAHRVEETVTVLSCDTPENRAVKSFLNVLERDSRAIAFLAEAEEELEAAGRALLCAGRLQAMQAEAWLKKVTLKHSKWTQPPTQRESQQPAYALIARERSRYRKSFCFEWDQPLLTLPMRETWRLYEIWCFLTVLAALRGLGWALTQSQEVFALREGRLTMTLATGEKSRIVLRSESGQALSLTYNQAFAEGRESLSHTMQPDITISDGERVWILDAKFKMYAEPGAEGADINQMHAYRDAIVDMQGTRNVAQAWCLYAGQAQSANRAQITYGRTVDTPVGALCLRPGSPETVNNLRGLLEHWLAAVPPKPVRQAFPET
jgi:hypothetical protein